MTRAVPLKKKSPFLLHLLLVESVGREGGVETAVFMRKHIEDSPR
jgi:hypothetical protein